MVSTSSGAGWRRGAAGVVVTSGRYVMPIALLATMLANTTVAVAQQAAYARTGTESAQSLAERSLECLHRGEDAVNTR